MRTVVVRRLNGTVQVTEGGKEVVKARTIETLLRSAETMGADSPFVLGQGDTVTTSGLPPRERAFVLHALQPPAELFDTLEAMHSTLSDLEWEVPAYSFDNQVDGEPWGWFLTKEDPEPERWCVIPVASSETVVDVSASFEGAGMVGGQTTAGIHRWGSVCVATWYFSDPEPLIIVVEYEIEDWDKLVGGALAGFWDVPLCPLDQDQADQWSLSVDVDTELFSTDAIGQALTNVWTPCEDHADAADLRLIDVAGHDWRWAGQAWLPR